MALLGIPIHRTIFAAFGIRRPNLGADQQLFASGRVYLPRMGAQRTRFILAVASAAVAALVVAAPASAGRYTHGIDVSRFQAGIDWSRVAETKTKFAYVQASRGSGRDCLVAPTECGPDQWWETNYSGARANGIKVGAYHRAFVSGKGRKAVRRDARREARVFIRTVGKLRSDDLVPALDVEVPFVDVNVRRLRRWVRNWNRLVEKRLGAKPLIYTNNSSWQATGDAKGFARRGHRLWVANFNVPAPLVPASDWAGTGWTIWQHTSTGRVDGVNGNVDKNRLRGELSDLYADPPAPAEEPEADSPAADGGIPASGHRR